MVFPEIQLPTQIKDRLAQGHPWVYRNHVPANVRLPAGTWVRARCGNWSGYGLWDASGPIAIRIYAEHAPPDAAWLKERVRQAWDLRAPLRAAEITAYRWLFGEGDGVPGITVDIYDQYAVVATYMNGTEELLEWLVPALRSTAPLRGIVLKHRRLTTDDRPLITDSNLDWRGEEDSSEDETTLKPAPQSSVVGRRSSIAWGAGPPHDLVVNEHGLQFEADLRGGQKTGLFLDHRENRRFIETISAGKTVLNCFAYTGAFSLYALRGGATHVTSTDIGKGLEESAATNLSLSGLDAAKHEFVTADCFELLERYAKQRRSFDMIILDPPSFAKNKQSRFAAIRAYTRLNTLALRCIRPNGMLASASCTSQVGPEAFKDMLAQAGAQAKRRLQIIHEAGQPLDHPVPPQFPEGRYLKFAVMRVL